MDYLERAGGWIHEDDLASMLSIKRTSDMRRRYLRSLEEAAVVECSGKEWCLTEDWRVALEEVFEADRELERVVYGGKTADERQEDQRRRKREAYQNQDKVIPDEAPTRAEMDARRRYREGIDGFIRELEPVEASEPDLVLEQGDEIGWDPVVSYFYVAGESVPMAIPDDDDNDVDHDRVHLGDDRGGYYDVDMVEEVPVELTPAEIAALEAIRAYEREHGPGSFGWDRASAKGLFYTGPVRGH